MCCALSAHSVLTSSVCSQFASEALLFLSNRIDVRTLSWVGEWLPTVYYQLFGDIFNANLWYQLFEKCFLHISLNKSQFVQSPADPIPLNFPRETGLLPSLSIIPLCRSFFSSFATLHFPSFYRWYSGGFSNSSIVFAADLTESKCVSTVLLVHYHVRVCSAP